MKDFIIKSVLLALFCLAAGLGACAQNVTRQGNTFTQVSTKGTASGKETRTEFTYKDSKGVSYPVYLSSGGKAFIKRVSKKTGREYKQYLPEVGRQINPKAYQAK